MCPDAAMERDPAHCMTTAGGECAGRTLGVDCRDLEALAAEIAALQGFLLWLASSRTAGAQSPAALPP